MTLVGIHLNHIIIHIIILVMGTATYSESSYHHSTRLHNTNTGSYIVAVTVKRKKVHGPG